MKHTLDDIVIAEGNNELNVQLVPIAAVGMITLYATGLRQWNGYQWTEWMVSWYYPDEDKWRIHVYPDGKYYLRSWEPITPPPEYPIDLNNLIFKVRDYSEAEVCPATGYLGDCPWGPFGPFVVKDGGIYSINIRTGELIEGRV